MQDIQVESDHLGHPVTKYFIESTFALQQVIVARSTLGVKRSYSRTQTTMSVVTCAIASVCIQRFFSFAAPLPIELLRKNLMNYVDLLAPLSPDVAKTKKQMLLQGCC